jgi:hypothetical protein
MNKPKGIGGKNPQKKPNPVAPSSGVVSTTHYTNPLARMVGGGTSGIRSEGYKKVSILEPLKEEIPTLEVVLTPIVEGKLDFEFQTNLIRDLEIVATTYDASVAQEIPLWWPEMVEE